MQFSLKFSLVQILFHVYFTSLLHFYLSFSLLHLLFLHFSLLHFYTCAVFTFVEAPLLSLLIVLIVGAFLLSLLFMLFVAVMRNVEK